VIRIVEVTDDAGAIVAPEWLAKAESVHRQLRTALPADYAGKMKRVFADGARMCVAAEGDAVRGVAVYRVYENTFEGVHLYVDDLVTDERQRSKGVGRALMAHVEKVARAAGCEATTLDSGTQRQQAHKFYFREGMVVTSFHFRKPLG
jgi:GNAT superfamily N-acetyltransferase